MISSGRKLQPVRRDEHRRATRLEHVHDLGKHALGVRDVLDRLHREHRRKRGLGQWERTHVGDVRLALLAGERLGAAVDADRLAGRERVEGVPDAAAQVEHAPLGQQRRAQPVGGDMALVGRVEAALGGHHSLSGYEAHDMYFLERDKAARCSTSRTAAHSVLIP
jgi:hypothetical protein